MKIKQCDTPSLLWRGGSSSSSLLEDSDDDESLESLDEESLDEESSLLEAEAAAAATCCVHSVCAGLCFVTHTNSDWYQNTNAQKPISQVAIHTNAPVVAAAASEAGP